ncbi:MAG TPA: hypothetical protein VGM93_02590 [Acidimicrobiales bacterium]
MTDAADVEFFFDPICPWAWLTSRWVSEVAGQRDLTVDWRFICLAIVNDRPDDPPRSEAHIAGHAIGQKLLRVAAAVRDAEGPGRVGELYTQFGGDLHVRGRRDELAEHWQEGFPDYLASVGLAPEYVAAAQDEAWDAVLRSETAEALSRAGSDVGTPIISFTKDGVTSSFFGPVISRVPRGEEAIRLWDAVWEVATFPGLAEIKRSLRERPQLADSLG